jgi:predicted ribosomally synthesized peptide with nif11-like leader
VAVETACRFLELVANDPTLQTQFSAANPQGADEIVAFASQKGFIFTDDDLHAAVERYTSKEEIKRQLDAMGYPVD